MLYAGSPDEVYIEVVQGFGEVLVGNYSGQALQATVHKEAMSECLAEPTASIQAVPQQAVTIHAFPSKSVALLLSSRGTATRDCSDFIFRSDSNGEDLEG